MLNVNDVAPDFTLKNTSKEDVSLSQFSDKTVVLAFYPGAYTGVCDTEMCTLQDNLKAFNELERLGVKNIFYLDGDNLLGQDGEAATDGSHPSDLGMTRYADAYEPVLRRILKQY